MPMTPALVKALHERFAPQVATDLIAWLEMAFQPARVVARPPRSVSDALGEELTDELMDYILAAHNSRPSL